MKIDTQIQEDHQAKLTVHVDNDQLEGFKHRAARQIAGRVKIAGFRPGKAPYPVIVRQIGDEAILEQALELLVEELYPKILDEAKIEPYSEGKLENLTKDPLTLEFLVPLKAEVTLGDYRSLREPYELPQITDAEVEKVLADLRQRHAVIEPVERPVQDGDVVSIRLSSIRKNVEEGQDSALIRERTAPIIIQPEEPEALEVGEEDVEEWPFPGFSRNLIGLSPDDEKTLSYTYPEDSSYEMLRGVEAEFHLAVENVKARTLPELNDEFAASVGDATDLAGLRANIRTMLESQATQNYNQTYDDALLDEVVKQSTFKYPSQMLENEVESVIDGLKSRLEQQNMSIDLYLKARQMDMDGLKKEALPVAETRMRKSLALFEMGKVEDIHIEQSEWQNETVSAMNELARMLPEKEARRLSDREVQRGLASNVMMDLITRKVTERLRDIGSGKWAEQEAQQAAATETEIAPVIETAAVVDEAAAPPPAEDSTD